MTTVVLSGDDERLAAMTAHYDDPLVVVVTEPGSPTLARLNRTSPQVRVIDAGGRDRATARNLGVAAAVTPYVAFAGDRTWWAPGSLGLVADILDAHHDLGLVAGCVLVGPDGERDAAPDWTRSPLPRTPGVPGVPVLDFVADAAVVRRTALLEIGGFDPLLDAEGEGERMALDLADGGHLVRYLEDVALCRDTADDERSRRSVRRRFARNQVLTAALRRPWRVFARRTTHQLRRGSGGLLGVVDAVRRLPQAYRRRRLLTPETELQARLVELGGP